MSVAKAVVRRPVLWLVVFALALISGVFLLGDIDVEMFPDIEIPFLLVMTVFPGADPETVENSLTAVLESAIAGTAGIQEMTSTSSTQMSMVVISFDFGTDMDAATNRVRDNIDMVRPRLPDNAMSPILLQIRPADLPMMRISVIGEDMTQNELRAFAINNLEDAFRQVEGVASVNISGGQDLNVMVNLSQNRLEAHGVTINEIARMLAAQNLGIGAGFIEEGDLEYTIRTTGEFASIEEIANTVVWQMGGADIRLQDIGDVGFGFEEERSSVFINGEPGVSLAIMRQSGMNAITVANNIYSLLESLEQTLPAGMSLKITQDGTLMTRSMIDELVNSAVFGIILAMLVLIYFLRNIRSSIIVGLSIPISFVITLLVMALSNISINMMTLAGLILGIGMTVDCSIVVIESITTYRKKGERKSIAAILAGEEVMPSLIAATITTVCVFLPVILFRNQLGFIGIMLQDMIITIVVSVVASLFVGICLVPVLASKWLPIYSRAQKPIKNPALKKIDNSISNGIKSFNQSYQKLLAVALKHRFVTILFVACAFLGSVFALGRMDITMTPNQESDTVVVDIEMPLGTRYAETKAVALELQEFAMAQINGISNIVTEIGGGGFFGGGGSHSASVSIVLGLGSPGADSESSAQAKLRTHFVNFPNVLFTFADGGGMGGMGGGNDIEIVVRTNDLNEGITTAQAIGRLLEANVPEVQDIIIDTNEGLPQISIDIDRQRAFNMGLNVATIAQEVAASMNGVTATTFRQGGIEYDVILQLAPEYRAEIPDLGRIFVRAANGVLFSVDNFANIERTQGPVSIRRENQTRTFTVTANVREGFSIRAVEARIQDLLDEHGIQATLAGAAQDTMEMLQTFLLVIALALILVFGVMAAQYESFRDPFINFCTIPLLLIGVVLIHIITGNPITAFTMIGIVLLAGLVTNNGILLVDYTNQLVRGGMDVKQACMEAGANRFRPVLMTALTTMLALAPMAFFPGQSAGMTAPIGLVVFGGLTSATIMTLVFVPVLYSLFHNNKEAQAVDADY